MKRRILPLLLACAMLLSLAMGSLTCAVSAASSQEILSQLEQLRKHKNEIQEKISGLEQQKQENLNEIEEIVTQKNTIDQQITLLHDERNNLNAQMQVCSQLVADKQDELDQAENRLEELNEKNKARIRAMEENGPLSYWSVLFKASSFSDFLDRLSMIEEIASADQRRLDEMSRVAEQVSRAKEDLAAEKKEMEAAQAELDAVEMDMEEKRKEADQLLSRLIERGEEYQQFLLQAHAEVGSLDEDIAAREQAYNEQKAKEEAAKPKPPVNPEPEAPDEPFIGGDWIIPCDYVYVSDPYGWRIHPVYGTKKFHSGIDLAAYLGNPVRATRGGTVTEVTSGYYSGNYITVNHGDGFSSSYLHLSSTAVQVGQTVSQGEVIGYVGATGASCTGPHLHFSIYLNGATVDPAQYVKFY